MVRAEPVFEPFEQQYISLGPVCGVDEAGRGPLAGDVYAAAVILPEHYELPGLNDSKQCAAKVRERLCESIKAQAAAWAVGIATVDEIAELNILRAALLAMRRAVEALRPAAACALVDGNQRPPLPIPCETVVRGDARCASVAAASIVAKVTRDHAMAALDEAYPGYGFAQHKGYGTQAHYEALARLGPCYAHRLGFLH
ncbi:MAG: ribonuclease HII [Oscillospiraceae bacterium]|jgi:ribonuclease HII|nr:ribonuclease HII [Oscillospiraceae bacterium]